MARDITSAALSAAQADHLRIVLLAHLDYVSTDVFVCTAPFSIFWEPDAGSPNAEFLGVGNLGKMSVVSESGQQRPEKVVLELTGVPSSYISQSLTPSEYAGRPCRVWMGFLDADGALINSPVLLFRGKMDTQDADIGGKNSRINLTVVDRRADWQRPRVRRYTDAEQQAAFPGDLGFQFAAKMADKEIAWPEKIAQDGG